jgi:hypothetical protein
MAEETSKGLFDTFSPTSLQSGGGKPHDSFTRRPSDQYWAGYQLEQYDILAPRRAHWSPKSSYAEDCPRYRNGSAAQRCSPTRNGLMASAKSPVLAGRYAEKSLRDVRIMDGASC